MTLTFDFRKNGSCDCLQGNNNRVHFSRYQPLISWPKKLESGKFLISCAVSSSISLASSCIGAAVVVYVCVSLNGSRSNGALEADKGSTKRRTKEATLPLCPCVATTTTFSFYLSLYNSNTESCIYNTRITSLQNSDCIHGLISEFRHSIFKQEYQKDLFFGPAFSCHFYELSLYNNAETIKPNSFGSCSCVSL